MYYPFYVLLIKIANVLFMVFQSTFMRDLPESFLSYVVRFGHQVNARFTKLVEGMGALFKFFEIACIRL